MMIALCVVSAIAPPKPFWPCYCVGVLMMPTLQHLDLSDGPHRLRSPPLQDILEDRPGKGPLLPNFSVLGILGASMAEIR